MKTILFVIMTFAGAHCCANEAKPLAADPVIEARVMNMAEELRCLVCQNQTLADSHAGLAVDLRQEMREMLASGKSDKEVMAFMVARYGDFVLYRPPFKETTAFLWLGPFILLIAGLLMLYRFFKKSQQENAP